MSISIILVCLSAYHILKRHISKLCTQNLSISSRRRAFTLNEKVNANSKFTTYKTQNIEVKSIKMHLYIHYVSTLYNAGQKYYLSSEPCQGEPLSPCGTLPPGLPLLLELI